jgi:hypothetical protein
VSVFNISDIHDAHTAHRRRLIAKRRLIVLQALIAALRRDRAALLVQQEKLRQLRAAIIDEPLNRVYGNFPDDRIR